MLYHNLRISCTFHQKYVPTYAVGFTDSDEGQDSHEKQIVKIYDMWNDGIWWFLTIFECFACAFCDYGTCHKKFYNIHKFAV